MSKALERAGGVWRGSPFITESGFKLGAKSKPKRDGGAIGLFRGVGVVREKNGEVIRKRRSNIRRAWAIVRRVGKDRDRKVKKRRVKRETRDVKAIEAGGVRRHAVLGETKVGVVLMGGFRDIKILFEKGEFIEEGCRWK